jgi:hypothetical protein
MKTENDKGDEYTTIKKVWYFFGDVFDIMFGVLIGLSPFWRKIK